MPEEVDIAEEALVADAVVIVMAIAEITQSLIIHLKERWKMVVFSNSQWPKADIKLLNAKKYWCFTQFL